MFIYSLNAWFDDLPDDLKDRLAELCYKRDLDIADKAIKEWSITFLKTTPKRQKQRKRPKAYPKLHKTPITDDYIISFMDFIGLSAKDMDDNHRSHNAWEAVRRICFINIYLGAITNNKAL